MLGLRCAFSPDELLEQLDHFMLVANFWIKKELTADDSKMLADSEIAAVSH